MKTIWIRISAVCLILLMLLSVVSCSKTGKKNRKGKDDPNVTDPTVTTEATGEQSHELKVEKFGTDNNPAEFRIAGRSERSDYLVAASDGDLMHKSTYRRNMKVQELYNVDIQLKECGHSDTPEFREKLETEFYAQNGAWEIVCPAWWWGTDMKGYYDNILKYENEIDLTDNWWLPGCNENTQFAGYMPSIYGDASFDLYYNLEVVYYNKDLAASIGLNPYEYIDETRDDGKKWTIEVLDEAGRQVRQDKNGDGIEYESASGSIKGGDVIGSLANASSIQCTLFSLGMKCARVEGEDVELCYEDSKNLEIFERYYAFVNEQDYNIQLSGGFSCLHAGATNPFLSNQVLFLFQAFRVGPTILASPVNYGITPSPMLDDDQEAFVSSPYDLTSSSIMVTAKDKHMAALVWNGINALTWEEMGTTYFDTVMGLQVAGDRDSSRMIPIIRDSIYCDFTWANFGNMNTNSIGQWASCISQKLFGVTTYLERDRYLCEDALEAMRDKMVQFRDRDY